MSDSARLYFDNHASTPVDPRVSARVASVSDITYANPHADDHAAGWSARDVIEQARGEVADAINADPDEIIFTSGATEADNLGVLGAALGAPQDRRRILVSSVEHKAVLESAFAAQSFGYSVELIPVDTQGRVDLAWLDAAARPDVAVISVMAVNNEVGVVQPVGRVAEIGRRVGAFVHTDATQAPAAHAVDVLDWNVDAASFSSHKVYGPKGVGALFLSSTAPWRPRPLMFGGGQEQGLRPGTLPTALCAGFGLAMSLFSDEERTMVASLRDLLAAQLSASIAGLKISANEAVRHPGSLHLRIHGVDAKSLVTRLQPVLAVSTGSACTSGLMTESHVLRAMGLDVVEARSGLRLSLGRFTTEQDVGAAVSTLVLAVEAELRAASTSPKRADDDA